ncbi:MAG TPA: hypothetical protein VD978_02440 [Azospirillum sp.]|nr:hypothetical protein [Azospirillum sp.]
MSANKKAPRVYLKREQETVRTINNLTLTDRALLEKFRDRYEAELGLRPSVSIVISVAISALQEKLMDGELPKHSALYVAE